MTQSTTKLRNWLLAAALLVAGAAAFSLPRMAAADARVVPPPAIDEAAGNETKLETAVFAGGCFWGVQGVFQHVAGVTGAVSGYAGGEAETARYQMVGTGKTGHAESVRITFDPSKVSYGRLLRIYFSVALDPTELNRQGPDVGTQYRSTIFPANAEQTKIATAYIDQLDAEHVFAKPIATTVEPGRSFYRPRPITRTSWSLIRAIPTSSSTICRRSRT